MSTIEFWKDFWPNFASSIATGIIFSFIIAFVVQLIRKPKLRISLSIGTATQNRHYLTFYCINKGNVGLMTNEIQWHIYFGHALVPDKDFGKHYKMIAFDNKPYYYFSGTNSESCLPETSLELISIPIKVNDSFLESKEGIYWLDESAYYYSITTTRGQMKYTSFWEIFKRPKVISDGSFVKRIIFEIKDKVL